MDKKNITMEEALAIIEEQGARIKVLEDTNASLTADKEKMKRAKDDYYKYWQNSEDDLSRIKKQLAAVLTIMGNIV